MSNKKGLTLIELLAVIAIIAILFVLLIPQINNAIDKARETGVMTDFRSYEIALHSLFMEGEEERTHSVMNKYLDKSIHFNHTVSKNKSPYKNHYIFDWISDDYAKVMVHNNKNERLSLYVYKENGSIKTKKVGFKTTNEEPLEQQDGDFMYIDKKNGKAILSEYVGENINVSIPREIKGLIIDEIGGHAFNESKIETVQIPDTVEKIHFAAFANSLLKEVEIPNGVTEIRSKAFVNNKIETLLLPNTLVSIGYDAFRVNNLTSLVLPSSIQKIEDSAFLDNFNLINVSNKTMIENEHLKTHVFGRDLNITN